MQYILSQEEYDEYISLKTKTNRIVKLSDSAKKVYRIYADNPWITYNQASKWLGISEPAIFNHIKRLEKKWYVARDADGNVSIRVHLSTLSKDA